MKPNSFFVTGGALLADANSYVQRAADTELLTALRGGEFCYVLTTRQMGKTSLTVRTAAQLREEGCAVVVLDLTAFGQNLDVEQWYFSMLSDVAEKLRLEDEMEAYWEANARRAPLHRFFGAIREIYLERKRKPLVIFVDEIDAVRSLRQFKADEFFAGIRECYNRRTEDPKFQRLTFCLLGVATPSDLISDQRMTPFNIGRGIELGDFTSAEAAILAGGLSPHRETALTLLDRVMYWTSGHPYLTQRFCAELEKAGVHEPAKVDEVCRQLFLANDARTGDENLQFVRERLLRSELDQAALLDTYAKVCRSELVADDHHHPIINELRLCGIVRVAESRLQPRNRIYSRIFDLKWVREHLPDAEAQRQRAAYYRGIRRVAGIAAVVSLVVGGLALQAWRSGRDAKAAGEHAKLLGQKLKESAEEQATAAELAQRAAEGEKKAAERAVAAAEQARAAAERERQANEERLRQAGQTEAALQRLVDTQGKVQTLLEAFTPLIGQKAGKLIPERAEQLVRDFSKETTDDPRILIGQAGLRQVCGRLYLRLGNETKALEQAETARALVKAELERKPPTTPTAWKADPVILKKMLHDCHLLIGDVILGGRVSGVAEKKTMDHHDRAMVAYREAHELARQETTTRPEDVVWRDLYFNDRKNLGDTERLFNLEAEAERHYRDAMKELDVLRQRKPAPTDLAWIEASLHDRLGTMYMAKDNVPKARAAFDRGLQLRETASGNAPEDDPERLSDLALSYNKLGNVALSEGNPKAALAYYERCLAMREKLCELSPRPEWQRHRGFTLSNIAQALWKSGQNAQALQRASERLKLAEELLDEDPSDPLLRVDCGNALFGYADILLNAKDSTLNDRTKALEFARRAAEQTDRRDPRILAFLAQALRLNKAPGEAYEIATEAERLLPPEDARSVSDKYNAKEIDYELRMAKSNGGTSKPDSPKSKAKRKRR